MSDENKESLVPKTSYSSVVPEKEKDSISEEPDSKIEKVVKGTVKDKKKTLGDKFRETFIVSDAKSVGDHVVMDILIPAARDTLWDFVTGAIEMLLYGDSRPSSRRRQKDGTRVFTSYDKMYSNEPRRGRPVRNDREPELARDFVFEFDFREDANEVLSNMMELIDDRGYVLVSEMYKFMGRRSDYTKRKYGWDDLSDAYVRASRGIYLLYLPKPILID